MDALIANCATLLHDPPECDSLDPLPAKFLPNGMIKSENFCGASQSQYYHELFERGTIS